MISVIALSIVLNGEYIDKGERLYKQNCVRCHNSNPEKPGSIGPAIVDVPLDVFRHKVLTGRYPDPLPEGFTPRRKTKIMPKFPQLKEGYMNIYGWLQGWYKEDGK